MGRKGVRGKYKTEPEVVKFCVRRMLMCETGKDRDVRKNGGMYNVLRRSGFFNQPPCGDLETIML